MFRHHSAILRESTTMECWYVLIPIRKETVSEAWQGRARFQQHRDSSCHKVFFFLQGKAPKEIHAILTEILAFFLPGWAKDLSAPLYKKGKQFQKANPGTEHPHC